MQLLDRITLDPGTDGAATQDCPNHDRDLLPLTVYNTTPAFSAANVLAVCEERVPEKCAQHMFIYQLLIKHLDIPADNLRLPLLGFAFPMQG